VLQCVVVCCSVLQCAAVCCSVLQCVAVCCSVLQYFAVWFSVAQLQCVAAYCSVLHYLVVRYSMSQYVAMCYSVRHLIHKRRSGAEIPYWAFDLWDCVSIFTIAPITLCAADGQANATL